MFDIKKYRYSWDQVTPELLKSERNIDYNRFERKLKKLRYSSIEFLDYSLNNELKYKKIFINNELHKESILLYDAESKPYINKSTLDTWILKHPFDPSMHDQPRDLLKFCIELKMEEMFYAYETTDSEILNERAIARELLLAEAKRLLDPEEFNRISSDYQYEIDPHILQSFIYATMVKRHKMAFKMRIDKLGNSKVYFLFSVDNSKGIYEYSKDLLINLRPMAFISSTSGYVPTSKHNGQKIPIYNLLPFIKTAPTLPIIAFGTCSYYMIALLKSLGCKNEVIPCAFEFPADKNAAKGEKAELTD